MFFGMKNNVFFSQMYMFSDLLCKGSICWSHNFTFSPYLLSQVVLARQALLQKANIIAGISAQIIYIYTLAEIDIFFLSTCRFPQLLCKLSNISGNQPMALGSGKFYIVDLYVVCIPGCSHKPPDQPSLQTQQKRPCNAWSTTHSASF